MCGHGARAAGLCVVIQEVSSLSASQFCPRPTPHTLFQHTSKDSFRMRLCLCRSLRIRLRLLSRLNLRTCLPLQRQWWLLALISTSPFMSASFSTCTTESKFGFQPTPMPCKPLPALDHIDRVTWAAVCGTTWDHYTAINRKDERYFERYLVIFAATDPPHCQLRALRQASCCINSWKHRRFLSDCRCLCPCFCPCSLSVRVSMSMSMSMMSMSVMSVCASSSVYM